MYELSTLKPLFPGSNELDQVGRLFYLCPNILLVISNSRYSGDAAGACTQQILSVQKSANSLGVSRGRNNYSWSEFDRLIENRCWD